MIRPGQHSSGDQRRLEGIRRRLAFGHRENIGEAGVAHADAVCDVGEFTACRHEDAVVEHVEQRDAGRVVDIEPGDQGLRIVDEQVAGQDRRRAPPLCGSRPADRPTPRVCPELTDEVRYTPPHLVAVDHVVVQEKARVEQFESDGKVDGGRSIRPTEPLVGGEHEGRAGAFAPMGRAGRRPPEVLVLAAVPGRVGHPLGEEVLDALLDIAGLIEP